MKPSVLSDYLLYGILRNYSILVTGKPGIGKSDIVEAVAKKGDAELLISHPVVSDPTDYKGLPFPSKDGKRAHFLPYGDLEVIMHASKPTVCFLDDLGQASTSVQAACMQLILARRINGHAVSPHITFIAATNRKQDKAGVSGFIDPLKSRFTIIPLEVDKDDWIKWAIQNDMPPALIAFIRFKDTMLEGTDPSTDIVNTASPRTIANAGRQQANDLPEKLYRPVFEGAAGIIFATEYMAFLDLMKGLPSLESIIAHPDQVPISPDPGLQYAIISGLAKKMDEINVGSICQYLDRLDPEFSIACMTDGATRNPIICETKPFIKWASLNNYALAA